MSVTEPELMAKVVAAPQDDSPRLAYADWLDAHGDEPRARFIRVQCQQEQLRREAEDLLAQHGESWCRPLRALEAEEVVFHRGFPEEFRIHPQDYFDNVEKLRALTPVRRLTLRETDDAQLGRFAAMESNRHLEALRLPSGGFTHVGLNALSTSPHLSQLTEFVAHSADIGVPGAIANARAPFMNRLRKLDVHGYESLDNARGERGRVIAALDVDQIREFGWQGVVLGPDAMDFDVLRRKNAGPKM